MDRPSFFNGPEGVLRGIARWEIRQRSRSLRESIISAAHAYRAALPPPPLADAADAEPAAAEAIGVDLRRLVGEYATILGALGHDVEGVTELTMDAVREAYTHTQPDAALSAAVRRWCTSALLTPPVE
ncbi:MAG TPA: hypothetical protein VII52_05955 [Gemmatimonadaceae bacterium]